MPNSRFDALRAMRADRQEEETEIVSEIPTPETVAIESEKIAPAKVRQPAKKNASKKVAQVPKEQGEKTPTRGRGRPKGRRSDPDYTQISAYIPLDLLLAVQDSLADERRITRSRTARPVSDLVEELLGDWLKDRKNKKTDT